MSEEWYEWLRKNMPPHLFEAFEAERIHSAKWRDDEIHRLQSALAAEQKRREEAEAGLETLLGMLRENGINPESGIHQIAEERDRLQARVQELETDLEGQRLRADLAATMMAEDREAGKRWLDALRTDNSRLREALKSVLPDESGRHGGPLIQMVASYEDGTSCNDGYQQEGHKYKINHHDYTRARAALAQNPGGCHK